MKTRFKKVISISITLCMMIMLIPISAITAMADDLTQDSITVGDGIAGKALAEVQTSAAGDFYALGYDVLSHDFSLSSGTLNDSSNLTTYGETYVLEYDNGTNAIPVQAGNTTSVTKLTYTYIVPTKGSTISPNYAYTDKYNPKDVTTTVTLNGNTLVRVEGVMHNTLIEGSQYTFDESTGILTIKYSYVKGYTASNGGGFYLNIYFSAGAYQELYIEEYEAASTVPSGVSTADAASVTANCASIGGDVTSDGGALITERGVVYSKTALPQLNVTGVTKVTSAGTTGAFTADITGLTYNTTYYARAYAANGRGTTYGNEVSFQTLDAVLPSVSTADATSVTARSASIGGDVTSDGGADVTERGVVFGTTATPQLNGTGVTKVTSAGTTGTFTANLTGLNYNTIYYARAYATNGKGTTYGNGVSFHTLDAAAPSVSTADATSITTHSASIEGNVTFDGGADVTERGIVYGTTTIPELNGTGVIKVTSAGTTGTFTADITGLTSGIRYYVRAYATNSKGTTYGNEISFQTLAISVASVTITPNSSVTVGKGRSQTFTATVIGTNGPSQAVTWSVTGGSTGTTITDGILSVSASETASTVKVRATSDADDAKFGEVTVIIITLPNVAQVTIDGTTTEYNSLDEAFEAAAGETAAIKLLADVDLTSEIVINANDILTLDFNSHKITSSTFGNMFENYGTLTVKDSGSGGGMENTNSDSGYSNECIYNHGGTVTVSGGYINGDGMGIFSNGGTVTVSGGSISGYGSGIESDAGALTVSGGSISGYYDGIYSDGTLIVSGGSISGDNEYGIYSGGTSTVSEGSISGGIDGIYFSDGESLKINGGTISGQYAVEAYNTNVTINGGTLDGTICGFSTSTDSGYLASFTFNAGTVKGALVAFGLWGYDDVSGNWTLSSTPWTGYTLGADSEYVTNTYTEVTVKLKSTSSDDDNNSSNNNDDDNNAPSAGSSAGWSGIQSLVSSADDGESIDVNMNGTHTLPSTILSKIKGKNVNLVLDMGGYTWTINGKNVTDAKDINLNVTLNARNLISSTMLSSLAGTRTAIQLKLSYDGDFGFTATLKIKVGTAYAGQYANLYYYNPTTNKLEYMANGKVDENGYVELDFSHASSYAIVMDSKPMTDELSAGEPITDSSTPIKAENTLPYVIILVTFTAGMIVYKQKKKAK